MKSTFPEHDNTSTPFVHLDTHACTACWECLDACPNNVIDKSFLYLADTLIHEHVLMYEATQCTGCLKCMEACKFDAIRPNIRVQA